MAGIEDPKRLVRESYEQLGETYTAWARHVRVSERQRYLRYALDTVPSGSRVLDLGCGDGFLLTAQLAERFNVVGVDISPKLLALAKRNVPDANFICADMSALEFPDESFDAVTAFYSLTHLPPGDVPSVIKSIARWLRPGGSFIGSLGAFPDAGSVDEWLGVPMYFSGLGIEDNRCVAEDAGLIIERDALETDDEFGIPITFHWIAARKQSG